MDSEILKVSGQSSPKMVAGAIASVVRRDGGVSVQAVGAGAVNQAVKAIAIARDYVAPNGIDLISVPSFFKIETDDGTKTGIRFVLEPRGLQGEA
ncbi:MAG: stage V sporulation protein S [Armatimonadetes bacterium]|jgi:stage V sporulation protein S|nr:stage V sporulation protein S [Armatimonadota bacterium]